MRLRVGLLVLGMLWCAAAAQAEVAGEASRSAFGTPRAVAVNSSDGSVWAATGSSVMHLSALGEVLSKTDGMASPEGIAVNTDDGTCWVADTWHGQVVHLATTGEVLWRGGSFGRPLSVSVYAGDGSCWVADSGAGTVVHLADSGAEIIRTDGFTAPHAVSVNPADGSCWVADLSAVTHLSPDAVQLWKGGNFEYAVSVSASGLDGSCWVADADGNAVVQLLVNGHEQRRRQGLGRPESVSVDQSDGSVWIADSGGNAVMHVSPATDEAWRSGVLRDPRSVAANTDGSCWVGEEGRGDVVHLASDATESWRGGLFLHPVSVAVDPSDGSVWMADPYRLTLAHLDAHGTSVWSRTEPDWYPRAVALDPTDGSVWVANIGVWDAVSEGYVGSSVAHLASDGSGIWEGPDFTGPEALAVDTGDGSVWIANGDGDLVHLDTDGNELWRGGDLVHPVAVSVNPDDGSCWVADGEGGAVVHFDKDGNELWRKDGLVYPAAVSVNPTYGSCWAADRDGGQVLRFAADGRELSRTTIVGVPSALAVNPADGSCWIGGERWLVHLSLDAAALWGAPTFSEVRSLAVRSADGSCWVADTGNGQVVRIAIGLDANFSAPMQSGPVPLLVSFSDESLGSPASWYWEFGDGGTSTSQNPTHAYVSVGAFTVSLTVSDTSGSDTETKPGYITTAVVPQADFSAAPRTGSVPLAVDFTDLSANDPVQWAWSFGDGGTSTAQHPSHTYTEAGLYPVSLTATNAGGSDTETKGDYIDALAALTVDFSLTPAEGVLPLEVTFADLTDGATSWHWDFGDGSTSTAKNPAHSYNEAGYYTVTLEASNGVNSGAETKEGCVAVGFTDTAPDSWAFAPIVACATAGIVQGYWNGAYRPEEVVNRGQMAVYIARALAGGEERIPTGPATPTFTDVEEDHWAYRYVEYCADQGIVEGYWNDTYRPDESVNRGQMSVYIARSVATPTGDAGVPNPSVGTVTFPDVTDTSPWAWCYKYVEYTASLGIVQGYWDGDYHPEREVTRDQMAVYIQRAFDLPSY